MPNIQRLTALIERCALGVGRWALKNLKVQNPVARATPNASKNELDGLFDFLNRRDNDVEVRPIAGVEFGMEQFTIGANLESAAARRNQRERLDALAELKNRGRQTDGLRRVVSNNAVFDRHLGFHRKTPFRNQTIGAVKSGQEMLVVVAKFVTNVESQKTKSA